MRLTLFTDYALRSLIYLTWYPDRPCTCEEIARFYEISQDHVTKVLQHLVRKGYVRSRRGRRGGAVLAKTPPNIRIGAVIRDFEQIALLDCLQVRNSCTIEGICKLRTVLAESQRRMLAYLDDQTLADVAGPPPAPPSTDGQKPLVVVTLKK